MAQTFLPVVQAVAGAIPFAGPPMQSTTSGLLSILQAMDVRAYLIARMFLDLNAITSMGSPPLLVVFCARRANNLSAHFLISGKVYTHQP
ncbi:hypothetical protein CY34DRAFT_363626 [Suillus luteus UH-Slu-Lm8-n1]|uniref:Uncharacterized protein n=1 Tax=Suillus luteus UH-Slu-Lm8-n1 TaxID=930992 RepID=A0A0D0AX61_9AGAM|nr:hypothetical protein CY34DRAFT_363626 [Suillus luteus UH-Slu-Lm8-n1]